MLPDRVRDALALTLAGIVLVASAAILLLHQPGPGYTLAKRDGTLVVDQVTKGSEADRAGVRPGAPVLSIDNQTPAQALAAFKGSDYPDLSYTIISSSNNIDVQTPGGAWSSNWRYQAGLQESTVIPFVLGILMLIGGVWWMKGGRAGPGLRGPAIPLAAASAIPLVGAPLATSGLEGAASAAAITAPIASLILADALVGLIPTARDRRVLLVVAVICTIAAVALPLVALAQGTGWGTGPFVAPVFWADQAAGAWWALLAVSIIPALVLTTTKPLPGTPLAAADNPGGPWLIAAASTPAVAMLSQTADPSRDWGADLLILIWIPALVIARAVSRGMTRARLQRDLAVTVTEAERARLAAELHDVALQDLTLLVRRLDATGDAASAEMARGVSDRLRELCGELHLPILDELGAGPALEWLVGQVQVATGEELCLERSDAARPPAAVELTMFRVAQEAISNAVKHGGPPIVVRYATSPSAATLSVDDAGAGLELGRERIEPRPGHYGLATMQQRAEQIGALLSIRAWPKGGTRVSLEWKAS